MNKTNKKNDKAGNEKQQQPNWAGVVIKLGIDVHLNKYVVVRIIEGSSPERARKFGTAEALIGWIREMVAAGAIVYTCYEAGPMGYVLHRQLEAMGVNSLVIRPFCADRHGKRVKTDKRDASELAQALDRWVAGVKEALSVVRVPSEQEEKERVLSRQRDQLKRQERRLGAQGRSLSLTFGYRLVGKWWRRAGWEKVKEQVPDWLMDKLEVYRAQLLVVEQWVKKQTQELEEAAPARLPKRIGAMSWASMNREACHWGRFSNRRQVSSFMGLVPKEDSSGGRRFQGSINKHGNVRMRCLLIQAAWRLWTYQPDYRPVKKWRQRLSVSGASPGQLKKAIVAIARELAVDLWRLNTNQTSAEKLGLEMTA